MTTREVLVWFVVHIGWWVLSSFLLFPFVIAPFQIRLVQERGLPMASAGLLFTAINFVVSMASIAIMLFAFAALRRAAPTYSTFDSPPR